MIGRGRAPSSSREPKQPGHHSHGWDIATSSRSFGWNANRGSGGGGSGGNGWAGALSGVIPAGMASLGQVAVSQMAGRDGSRFVLNQNRPHHNKYQVKPMVVDEAAIFDAFDEEGRSHKYLAPKGHFVRAWDVMHASHRMHMVTSDRVQKDGTAIHHHSKIGSHLMTDAIRQPHATPSRAGNKKGKDVEKDVNKPAPGEPRSYKIGGRAHGPPVYR